jgi:diguanylate cyclase (GGDEF)-like protein/PAS domain S-box-containing protein
VGSDEPTPGPDWFEQIADGAGLVFFSLRTHPDVAFEYGGPALRSRLGIPTGSPAAAETVLARIEPDDATQLTAALATEPGQELSTDLRWRHLDGRLIHSRAWLRVRRRSDGSVVREGVLQDITELRGLDSELRRSEERNRLLAENAWEVIWTMGLDASITYVSPAVERVRGFTPAEAMRQSPGEINTPASAAIVGEYFQRVFAAIAAGAEPPVFRGELEYYRRDGSIMVGELQVIPHLDDTGRVVELLGVTRDISERKRFEAELADLAVTDPLTGLWNRRRCTEFLSSDLAQAHRYGQPLSLLMIDIDHFKVINDTYGHPAGDQVLIDMAQRLRAGVRTTDIVGRWGGEEFVVLLRQCALEDAIRAAEKLRSHIAETPFDGVGRISVSVGAAQLLPDDDLGSWLRRADTALYAVKRSGRDGVAGAP